MKVSFLGAGSWGLTLGTLLSRKGYEIRLWEINEERASRINKTRRADELLPGIPIPESLAITSNLKTVLENPDLLVFALPSQALRGVAETIKTLPPRPVPVVSVIKGIENKTFKRMSEILTGFGWDQVAAISGPSLAFEVIQGMPTSVVATSTDEELAREIQKIFSGDNFRIYTNPDIVGVELGGALKNVIVIASGICDGLGLGANTKGALLTRGLAEITRLGTMMGADPLTFSGLSGMGDLITTAFSPYSRNRSVGEALARGKTLNQILASMVMVAEGVETTVAAAGLARKYGVEMPITRIVYQVLFENLPPHNAIKLLLERSLKPELWH
jgi:glycerol-3-phosphate dehydrogenase (NAD(P)+)